MAKPCPHFDVRYKSARNFNTETGAPDKKPAGWFCIWCDQQFAPKEETNG